MSPVNVCPQKDIVCGSRQENWCSACPLQPDSLPVIPLLPEPVRTPEFIAKCECGRKIPSGADGYACPHPRCPIQPRATF